MTSPLNHLEIGASSVTIPARAAMTVIWNSEDGQEEVRGFVVYGLVDPGRWLGSPFPLDRWPTGTAFVA